MDELLQEWGDHLRAIRGSAAETVATYRRIVRQAVEAMELDDVEELSYEGVERYLRRLYTAGKSDSTRALVVTAMRQWCEWLATSGRLDSNPLIKLRRPKVYQREAPVLAPAEVELLIYGGGRRTLPADPLAARNVTLLAVSYICGLRPSEPGRLKLQDLGWQEGDATWSILIRGAKWQDEDMRMPTDRDTARLLGAYLEVARRRLGESPWVFPGAHGGPLTRAGVAWIFGERVEEVGIQPKGRALSPKILRHSIATHLLQAGWNIRDVQERMRHESVETTQRYTHVDRAKVARQLEKRHPLRTAKRREQAPRMAPAVGGFVRELADLAGQ